MVVPESEAHARGEVEATAEQPPEDASKTHSLSSLGRQSSIYSLTLDEFQHALCENGKNFGSMNMDEFLNNIWTAEENQAIHSNNENSQTNPDEVRAGKLRCNQPGLLRQGSLTLPAQLCHKTVDEVWAEIHKIQEQQQLEGQQLQDSGDPGTTQRQITFGEMTLEDFLIRAGVVRETCGSSSQQHRLMTPATGLPPATATPQYGYSDHQSTGNGVESGVPTYQTFPQSGSGEPSNYTANGKRNSDYQQTGVCFGGREGNGAGYATAVTNTLGSQVNSATSDGICTNQVDNTAATQYGMDMGGDGIRGRKRILDGPIEKVVERRQRRMIKNRESAARSRARKQAYTVELEAELNHLKEENARLKMTLAEAEKKRRQEMEEEMKVKPPTKAQKAADKLKAIRRTVSCSNGFS
ncbi:PREDICTED: protein ABSCISIC ACID-INSENSITIVE 5-like isoform X2 [Nelumbo nucifera]|nr:PREDICTED: protein ABSCISIC ACID-INSENSITIVE 5-like isoform X2 [Nelumbo nucifera]XP_010271677.1 PREDICTED: protein ABSCISIC ACID-INSENSITIVE 5-like isoform X2 [Nelumbo nucifera]XP_010271678.1 PREDICTED: protein ABSCISIC ACID-INSENSITIVE 5-like isoform X2 [Nelumbo nucifera]